MKGFGACAVGGHQPFVDAEASECAGVVEADEQGVAARVALVTPRGSEPAFTVADPQPFDEPRDERSELMPGDPDRLRAHREAVGGDAVAVSPVVVLGLEAAEAVTEFLVERVGAPQWQEQPPVELALDGLLLLAFGARANETGEPDPGFGGFGEALERGRPAAVLAAGDAVAVMGLVVGAVLLGTPGPPRDDRGGAVAGADLEDAVDRLALVGDDALRRAAGMRVSFSKMSGNWLYSWTEAL